MAIQTGQLLSSTNLNAAFVSTSADNTAIDGTKKFKKELYDYKYVVTTDNTLAANAANMVWSSNNATDASLDMNITGSYGYLRVNPTNTAKGLVVNSSDATTWANIYAIPAVTGGSPKPAYAFIGAANSTNGILIDASGNATISGTTYSTGNFSVGVATAASTAHIYENTTSTTKPAGLTIEQAGTGDARVQFLITNNMRFVVGIDNSDSDKFKIGRGDDYASGVDLTIDQNGLVGIGAVTPATNLHVKNITAGMNNMLRLEHKNAISSGAGLSFWGETSAESARVEAAWDANNQSSLRFYTYNTSIGEKMRIAYDGSVGIGKSSSLDALLDVNGNITVGSSTERVSIASGGIGFNRRVKDGGIYNTSAFAYQLNHIGSTTDTSDYFGIQVYKSDQTSINGNALTVNGQGYVGINTTTQTYPFYVNARAYATSLAVASTVTDLINNSPWYGIGNSNVTQTGGTGTSVQLAGYYGVQLVTNSGNLALNQSGNVGIGTISQTSKVEVWAASQNLNQNISGAGQTHLALVSTDAVAADKGGTLGFGGMYVTGNTSTPIMFAAISGRKETATSGVGEGYMTFNTWKTDGLKENMRLISSGYLGIGVTAPEERLHVNGSVVIPNNNYYKIEKSDGFNESILGIDTSNKTLLLGSSGGLGVRVWNATAFTDRMFFTADANERIGVGTTSPSGKVHIENASNSGVPQIYLTSGLHGANSQYAGLYFTDAGDNTLNIMTGYAGGTGNVITFSPANAEKMRIQQNGNVGIGNTSPNALLTVGTTTTNAPSGVAVFGGSAYQAENMALSLVNSSTGATGNKVSIGFHNGGSWSPTGKIELEQTNGVESSMNFYSYKSGLVKAMTITKDGYIGMGTSTPSTRLQLDGCGGTYAVPTPGLSLRGALHINSTGVADDSAAITFGGSSGTAGTPNIINSVQAGIYVQSSGSYGTKMYFATTNAFGTGAMIRTTIDHNGKMGIGTTAPNQRLHVLESTAGYVATFENSGGNSITALKAKDTTGYAALYFQQGANNFGAIEVEPTSSDMTFWSASSGTWSERMRILNANGYVGIGTTGPTEKLQVVQTSDAVAFAVVNQTTTTRKTRINSGTNGSVIDSAGVAAGYGLHLHVNGAEKARLTDSGYFGVNTTSPQSIVHIAGAQVSEISTATWSGAQLIVQGTGTSKAAGTGAVLGFAAPTQTDGTSPYEVARIMGTPDNATNADANGRLIFQTRYWNSGTSTWAFRSAMAILSNGNVGIGNTAPNEKLEVSGKIRATVDGEGLVIQNATASNNSVYMRFRNSAGTNLGYIGLGSTSSNNIYVYNQTTDAHIALMTTGAGNVGVGTLTPSQRFEVGTATTDYISAYGGYVGNATANIGGTADAAYFPKGLFSNGTNAWIYGTVKFNGAVSGATSLSVSGKATVTSLQVGSSATAGQVLTADASGNATWQAVTTTASYGKFSISYNSTEDSLDFVYG